MPAQGVAWHRPDAMIATGAVTGVEIGDVTVGLAEEEGTGMGMGIGIGMDGVGIGVGVGRGPGHGLGRGRGTGSSTQPTRAPRSSLPCESSRTRCPWQEGSLPSVRLSRPLWSRSRRFRTTLSRPRQTC